MSEAKLSFQERVESCLGKLSPAEQRVARVFRDNREEVLFASAAALAAKADTSDATVVRATRALGFSGMEDLRRTLAAEMRESLSPAVRLAETLREVGGDPAAAFELTLDIHVDSIEKLRRDVTPAMFKRAVELLDGARRVVVFGLGPSSAMAGYFAIQLERIGLEASSFTQAGILSADELARLRSGDCVVVLAYGRIYRELAALLGEADRLGLERILLTDTLAEALRGRFDLVLPVARGRADMLSMHTATLALIEALLVGTASTRPEAALASLRSLNRLRESLVGRPMDLPTSAEDLNR